MSGEALNYVSDLEDVQLFEKPCVLYDDFKPKNPELVKFEAFRHIVYNECKFRLHRLYNGTDKKDDQGGEPGAGEGSMSAA